MIRFVLLLTLLSTLTADGASQQMLMRLAWARRVASTPATWTPPGAAYICLSADFQGTLLRKTDSTANEVDTACPSSYAKASWYTTTATNSDPYFGWFDSAYNSAASVFTTNLASGNTVGIISGAGETISITVPPNSNVSFLPAATSTVWGISWWCYPTSIADGGRVFSPLNDNVNHLYRQNSTQFRWAGVASFNYQMTTNTWQLWTVTSSRKWYVNTVLVNDSTDYSTSLTKMTINGTVGAGSSIPSLVDDVYYWNGYEPTSNDVVSIYNHGSPATRAQ